MNEMNNGENNNQNQGINNVQQEQIQSVEQVQEQVPEERNSEPPKKSYCGLLIVFMIISLLLAGYIVYDKCLKKEEKDDPVEERQNQEENNIEKEESSRYAVIYDWGYNYKLKKDVNYFYLVQEIKDEYKVIHDFGTTDNKSYIGFYDNKFYFTDEYFIKYIDFSNNFEEKTWIELPNLDEHQDLSFVISEAAIIGDRLYFSLGYYNQGLDKTDGLLYLDFTAKSFDEYKQVINEVEQWYFSDTKDKIYYQTNDGVYELVIASNKKTKLIDFDSMQYNLLTKDIFYFKNKIFYSYDSTLYMNDISSKNTAIVTKNFYVDGGLLTNVMESLNNKLYYYTTEGKIYLLDVDINKSTLYHEISNKDIYSTFRILDDGTMVIYQDHNPNKYLVDGKEVDSIYKRVLLKDNSYEEIELNMFKEYININK